MSRYPTLSTSPSGPGTSPDYIESGPLWAPAVALFRRLRFRPKAFLIAGAFLVPIAMLAVNYVDARMEVVHVAQAERDGVTFMRGVMPLIKHGRQLRRHTMAVAAGGTAPPDLADIRSKFDADLEQVKAMNERYGERFGTTDALKAITQALADVQPASAGVNKVYVSYGKLNAAIVTLATKVADGSGLTLDPELDSYYLMDAAFTEIPNLLEATARMRVLSAAAAATGQNGAAAGIEVARQDGLAEYLQAGLQVDIDKVVSVHPELVQALDVKAAQKAIDALQDEATDDVGSGGPEHAKKIDARGAEVVAALETLQPRLIDQLDQLLQARVDGAKRGIVVTLSVICVFLLLAGYLFYSFSLVMGFGLREVRRHMKAMTDGDLTTNPTPNGTDEAAFLLNMLRDMQGGLRQIVGEVRYGADHLANASQQIATMSRELAQRTEDTAQNVERSASSIEQISATVRTTATHADEATTLATSNATAATRGGTVIDEMVGTMDGIRASSTRIADIIGVIDGIAFQTNILALNAAVEAARAGESGRGFAVVASEVRALAQRSAGAAREIKSLITESVEKVEAGTQIVRDAGQTMVTIVDSSRVVESLLSQIANGAKEQAVGVGEVGRSMSQLDTVAQSNTTLVEETAAAADALREQAQALLTQVARFKVA